MNKDRSWMWQRFDSNGYAIEAYDEGVQSFLEFAYSKPENFDSQKRIKCPCTQCKNMSFEDRDTVLGHLLYKGFMKDYSVWDVHGESNLVGVEHTTSHGASAFVDQPIQHPIEQMVVDGLGAHNFVDPIDLSGHATEPGAGVEHFQSMMRDAIEPLWDGCNKSVLEVVSELMNHKANGQISERVFDGLLQTVKSILPEGEKLPASTYHVKRKMKHLGLEYVKIHCCVNNCMLYYNNDADQDKCLKCGHPRYKRAPTDQKKGIPYKVLHYLPLIPRLKRLYMSEKTAHHMSWHAFNCSEDGVMQHPADSKAWKQFNTTHPSFASDPRNVRIGISTDGFAPFNHYGKKHSCWPVIITVYNLPPWMCMKEPYLFLNMVIPGYPGKSINVFLRPLIDELLQLWNDGVETFDISSNETFLMRAAVMWTISDFPAYALLSGWRTQGNLACPRCMEHSGAFGLPNGKKTSFFDCHRQFLPHDHPFRRQRDKFRKGTIVTSGPPQFLSGEEMYNCVSELADVSYNKKDSKMQLAGYGCKHHWIMKSIFWELPYWKTNLIRHCLDVMHIEKNVFENIWNTVMDVKGKTKDNAKARKDIQLICKRRHLELYEEDGKWIQPTADYVLSKEKQREILERLKELRFPDGYSSNISRCVDVDNLKISGLKTHDCHVMLQRLLPVAFRDMLPTVVWETITEVGNFLRDICTQTLRIEHVKQLQSNIVVTLCKLEKIFPPSFFDPSVHLLVHLAEETLLRGTVQYTWMYRFERFLGKLKRKVGNKAYVESSICEAYLIEETSTFCSHYFDPAIRTRLERIPRSNDGGEVPNDGRLSIFSHPGRGDGKSRSKLVMTEQEQKSIQSYVLMNTEEIIPYIRLFDQAMRNDHPGITDGDLEKLHYSDFSTWLSNYVKVETNKIDPRIYELGLGPSRLVTRYSSYFTNGLSFHTEEYGVTKSTMNSGVCVKGGGDGSENLDYYGMIQEVWELEYLGGGNTVALFKCVWFDTCNKMRVHQRTGLVDIDNRSRLQSNEEFVLASQAQQVYYMSYPCKKQDRSRRVVCKTTSRGRYKIQSTVRNDASTDVEVSYQEEESQFPIATDLGIGLDDVGILVEGNGGVEVPNEDNPATLWGMDS